MYYKRCQLEIWYLACWKNMCTKYKMCTLWLEWDQREIAWLKEGTPAYFALKSVVRDTTLLNDLKHLTKFNHTGQFEVYYTLHNKYCLKQLHFSWNDMAARTELAILDHNSGTERAYVHAKDGKQC